MMTAGDTVNDEDDVATVVVAAACNDADEAE